MKRLRSSDDLDPNREKAVAKDCGRREEDSGTQRSASSLHRSSYYKSSDSGRKVLSSSTSRYDRLEDDKEKSRLIRKRSDHDLESHDRRKSYDWHRDVNEKRNMSSSPRAGYGMDRINRSESFSGPRRDFPKGFRSERDRPRRDGIVTSWRRFGGGRDGEDGTRIANEVSRGSRTESEDASKEKSPPVRRSVRSPGWSRDSGSEKSKSVDGKKCEDMPVESVGPSSEREEGELEPDPQPPVVLTKPVVKDKSALSNSSPDDLNTDLVAGKVNQGKSSSLLVEKGVLGKSGSSKDHVEAGRAKDVEDAPVKNNDLPDSQETSVRCAAEGGGENDKHGENEGSVNMELSRREGCSEGRADGTFDNKLSALQEQKEDNTIIIQMKADDVCMTRNVEIEDGTEVPLIEKATQNFKHMGKGVGLSPSNSVHCEDTTHVVDKLTDLATSGHSEMEKAGPIGFQFLSTDPIKNHEKVDQLTDNKHNDKLALELSLSLPNVLLPIGSQGRGQAPGSPSHGRSIQSLATSFRTNSDGFTASMSFSGSQQFTHNPSCSLSHNALDFEQSVGSKPLFHGVDWNALASDEKKNKDIPVCQGLLLRENGLHLHPQVSRQNSSEQAIVQHVIVTAGSSKLPVGLERQLSFDKHLSGGQDIDSYENGPDYCKDWRQLMTKKDNGGLQRSNGHDGKELALPVGTDFAESVVAMLVSEPLHTVARRFNDMNGQNMACVKDFVREIISNPVKQWQLSSLQKTLQKRTDIALDMLVNLHQALLEILVALKTGSQDFLLQKYDIPSPELAEIYLNMRCRNLNCRSILPVDECDCKICSQRKDFCRECMCLVCSKFDMASNTCSWVGCDVCLHWCHADCGLRESHIRNGRSAIQGTTEMQFYCVACEHPSEMFGFVKEVFQNFVKQWTVENLSRELEYVRRIFCASEDVRGKQLHEIAIRMLTKLASRADLQDVQNHMMSFFTETDTDQLGNSAFESRKELPAKNQECSTDIAGSSQGAAGWTKPAYSDKGPHLEQSVSLVPGFDCNRNDKYSNNLDFPKSTPNELIFNELESIVRIKQAEAKMFQTRAADARREAEALKQISVAKSQRIEEEYTSRIIKLRLAEAEELRKQKVEELEALERGYQEYFSMKMRMEADIKDLLLKMEATRRNLST